MNITNEPSVRHVWSAQARYNQWMNQNLYEVCSQLSEDVRNAETGAFFGSIHKTFAHLYLTDLIWMRRLSGDLKTFAFRDQSGRELQTVKLNDVLFSDFEQMMKARAALDQEIITWVDGLSASEVKGDATYSNMSGKSFTHPLWWALTHLFNHQTHHRGQITTLISQQGVDPGVTDLIAHLRFETP